MSTEPEQGQSDAEELATLLSQLEDLVKITLAAEKQEVGVSITSFLEVHKQLVEIAKLIEQFRQGYKESLAQFGLAPEDMRPTSDEIETLSPRERKLFERLTSLQEACEGAKERVYESLQQNKPAVKAIKEELKGKEGERKRRKDKFKGVGGKKGWLPS